jgi:hypothetical protein
MDLVPHPEGLPGLASRWREGVPLWKLVPKRNEAGQAYSDFMMMAPGLKHRSKEDMSVILRVIQGVLVRFGDDVAFADFNMDIRVLWVSLQSRPGLMARVVAALRVHVPELKLVAHHPYSGRSVW